MRLKHLNPPELPDWSALFSQVVVADGSLRIIAISGQSVSMRVKLWQAMEVSSRKRKKRSIISRLRFQRRGVRSPT